MQQTLVLALVPEIQMHLPNYGEDTTISHVLMATQSNLLGFWLCAPLWGRWCQKQVVSAPVITGLLVGLALCHALFWLACQYQAGWGWMSFARFLLGGLSSAFLPLAHGGYLSTQKETPARNLSMSRIGQLGAALTLGRLIGPLPALIPISLEIQLMLPCIALLGLIPLALKLSTTPPSVTTQAQIASQPSKTLNASITPISVTALLVTAWVALIQYELIPRVESIQPFFNNFLSIPLFPISLVWMGLVVLLTQRWLLPKFKRPSTKGLLLTGCLYSIGGTFWWWSYHWGAVTTQYVGTLASLTGFACAIPITTAFYTFCALNSGKTPAERTLISGRLNRYHTSGHLLGMCLTLSMADYWELRQGLIGAIALFIIILTVYLCRPWLTPSWLALKNPLKKHPIHKV